MNNPTMKSMRFDMWVDDNEDGTVQRNVCSFHIQRVGPSEQQYALRSEYREARKDFGLGFVSFYMDGPELHQLASGKARNLVDGYHNLSVCGDVVTFFDLEIQYRESNGTMEVPFLTLELPRRFWMYLERVARFVWAQQRKADRDNRSERYYSRGNRFELPIPLETLERFQRRYGQGKGKVVQNLCPRIVEKAAENPDVLRQVEHVTNIARNSTRSSYGVAEVSIYDDRESFYWVAKNPKGAVIMNGGINRHMEGERERWSINT